MVCWRNPYRESTDSPIHTIVKTFKMLKDVGMVVPKGVEKKSIQAGDDMQQ